MQRWPADWKERTRGNDCPMCQSGRPQETEFDIRTTQLRADAEPLPARLAR